MSSPLKLIILDGSENRIGMLNTDLNQVEEKTELQGLRTITITHPIKDNSNQLLPNKYLSLLNPGNKIFQETNCDGDSVLYVIHGPKEIDPSLSEIEIIATEVARELAETPPIRFNPVNDYYRADTSFLNSYFNKYFTIGEVSASLIKFAYSGVISPMGLLREIELQTSCEFRFRYEYDKEDDKIIRYLDFVDKVGKTHNNLIEVGYNTENVTWSIDDTEVRIAAAPLGDADSEKEANNSFHQSRKAWENLEIINKNVPIPVGVTKDDNGNDIATYYQKPPYKKFSGQNYLVCDVLEEISALYTHINNKEKSTTQTPRIAYFDSSEENPYNMYWEAVEKIREQLQSEITIDTKIVDLKLLKGQESDYYNIGDVVKVKIKDLNMIMEGRIKETTKNPLDRDSDNIKIGTPEQSFLDALIRRNRTFISNVSGVE